MAILEAGGSGRALPTRPSRPSRPRTPSLNEARRNADQALQSAYQSIVSQFQPRVPNFREIPTFSADYYMPKNTLSQINRLLNASPTYNERQLRQQAQTQTNLLTNPQIETLRQQINAFKSLIPRTQESLQRAYIDASQRVRQGTQDLVTQAVQEAQRQGGLRAGVIEELQRRAYETARPIFSALEADRQANIAQIIGALETEKQNAQNLLDTIEANRGNMTKENFNALRDQAIQRWRVAQQQQLQFLQGIAAIEAGARSNAARFQQEAAAAYNQYQQQSAEQYNQFMQQMIDQQLQSLPDFASMVEAQYQDNLNRWLNFLTGPDVRTAGEAMRRLQNNRNNIISSIGMEGYRELQRGVNEMLAGGVNPNYRPPYTIVNPGASSRNSRQTTSSSSWVDRFDVTSPAHRDMGRNVASWFLTTLPWMRNMLGN